MRTSTPVGDLEMAAARSYVPAESAGTDLDRTIAHLLKTAQVNTGHLDVHAAAARDGGDPALVTHHLRHALNHARRVSSHLVKLHDALSRRVPGVAAQLEDLAAAVPGRGRRRGRRRRCRPGRWTCRSRMTWRTGRPRRRTWTGT